MSKREAIEKIAGLLGDDVLSMSTTNKGSGLTTDSSVGSKDNSSAKGKITLEEFFARTDKVVLNIPTQEEFSTLVKIFKDLGITTNSGREFKEGMWQKYEHLTIISPDRKIGGGVEIAKYYGYEVINFKDLDLRKYLPQEELIESEDIDTDETSDEKITIDEFFERWDNGREDVVICCDDQLKGEILTKVFYRKGKTWFNGDSYLYNTCFDKNKHQVYYDNMGMCTTDENYIEEKQIPVYSFEKVDMSKYLTQDDAEIMANEWGYDTNFEYETPLAQYDITIDEFFANKGLLFIHCDEEWKAKLLTRVFDGKGEKWCDGDSYLNTTEYNTHREKSCYSNNGGIANISNLHTNIIYSFDKVDLSPYLSQMEWEEIVYYHNQKIEESRKLADENKNTKPRKKRGHKYKITVDDFWTEGKKGNVIVIHCNEKWKAYTLMKVFDRMGEVWCDGKNYTLDNYNFDTFGEYTCYNNMNSYGSYFDYKAKNCQIYDFSEVDLSKHLTTEEGKDLNKMLGIRPQDTQENKSGKKRGHKYKITVDEFWEDKYADREITTPNGRLIVRDKVIKVIHCDKRWKADILTSVFSKMGKKWSSGDIYFYSQYHQHKDQTCYDNMGDFCTKSWYEDMAKRTSVEIYPFNQVDLSKYLSPYQIETIRKSGKFDPIVNAQEMGEQ